jgi:hypothetical protein
MAWAKNGTSVTVAGSATNIMTISDQTSTKFNVFLTHMIGVSGVSGIPSIRAGNGSVDTGANYANRMSQDGGTDGTWASETYIFGTYAGSSPYDNDKFQIVYGVNIGAEEKLFILFGVDFNAAGAGSAPSRQELVAKWANTSVQYDNINNFVGTNGFGIGTNLTAIGTD